jgi:hypothetical protein
MGLSMANVVAPCSHGCRIASMLTFHFASDDFGLTMLISTYSCPYHEASFARECEDSKGSQRVHARMRERVHLVHHQRG